MHLCLIKSRMGVFLRIGQSYSIVSREVGEKHTAGVILTYPPIYLPLILR